MLHAPVTSRRLVWFAALQALHIPTATLLRLVATHPGVADRAWQVTAATLAAQHHNILGHQRQLAPLNMFFRACDVEAANAGESVVVPRTALLLTGAAYMRCERLSCMLCIAAAAYRRMQHITSRQLLSPISTERGVCCCFAFCCACCSLLVSASLQHYALLLLTP